MTLHTNYNVLHSQSALHFLMFHCTLSGYGLAGQQSQRAIKTMVKKLCLCKI